MVELPIIQKIYDLIKWYVPILNKLPRDFKFGLGDRISTLLYDILESLIYARYQSEKLELLNNINSKLEVLRYQTRLLHDFEQIDVRRYEFVSEILNGIGTDLGGWIKHQKKAK